MPVVALSLGLATRQRSCAVPIGGTGWASGLDDGRQAPTSWMRYQCWSIIARSRPSRQEMNLLHGSFP